MRVTAYRLCTAIDLLSDKIWQTQGMLIVLEQGAVKWRHVQAFSASHTA